MTRIRPAPCFLTILRWAFGSSPALRTAAAFSISCSGASRDDLASGVETGPTRPPGDLVELARGQLPHPGSVVLGQAGEQHGADRHVDADPERVGAADHPQQAALGELLHETAVLGEHAGVVHADPGADQARQGRAEPGREAEPADRLGDRVALLAAGDPCARQRLRALDGGRLGEVDDVDRREAGVRAARRRSRARACRRSGSASGTGRSTPVTRATSRPVRRSRSAAISETSPRVADMRTNCVLVSCSSGTCHAQPRSGSA